MVAAAVSEPMDTVEWKESQRTSLLGKRVVVVEDARLAEKHLRWILARIGLAVVGCAENGEEAVELVLRERPDIVLMDIAMPVMDGLEAARRIMNLYPVCLVMVTSHGEETYSRAAMEIGASGYVVKPVVEDALIYQLATAYARRPIPGSRRPNGFFNLDA